jgi:hypothetical protein
MDRGSTLLRVLFTEERGMDGGEGLDGEVLEHMLREGKISAEDLLRQTAAERVDSVVEVLLRHRSYEEVRRALHERIGGAPRADYLYLRKAYFKHCDRVPAIA